MTRLMLDHFRRWWWVLAIVGLLEFRLGWWIANRPQESFEFWAFMLALWAGANLLSYDFKRGALRPVAGLPLTGRQIGISWWLATVPLPALGMGMLLFLGASVYCQLHPDQVMPVGYLALTGLFALVWLGSEFPMIFGVGRGSKGICNFFLGALSVLMLFGSMLFAQGAAKSPAKCAAIFGLGGFLTIAGWLDARRFDLGRAVQFYRGRIELPALSRNRRHGFGLTPLELKIPNSQLRVPSGPGGVPFFVLSRVFRVFLIIATMSAGTALLWVWRGSPMPERAAVVVFAGTGSLMSFGVVMVFQLLPALRHLRLLRTLPFSGISLAGGLMVSVLLPLAALGAASAAVALFALDSRAALTFLTEYTFVLAPASLSVFLAVWLGEGKLAYALLIVLLFGSQQVQLRLQSHLHLLELPLGVSGAIATCCVSVALLHTCLAVRSSRHAYRAAVTTPGNSPFWING